jgi:hypothetical protein
VNTDHRAREDGLAPFGCLAQRPSRYCSWASVLACDGRNAQRRRLQLLPHARGRQRCPRARHGSVAHGRARVATATRIVAHSMMANRMKPKRRRLRNIAGTFLGSLLVTSSGCGPPPSTQCSSFRPTSVGEMRAAGASGCFELSNVVVVARTASSAAPRIYVQDPGGGPFSAVAAKCSARSMHACPPGTLANVGRLLDGAAVTVRGYYSHVKATGFEELYAEEVVDTGALLPIPDPVRLSVSDLSRDARVSSSWFQVATADVPATDPLIMYDFSPPELQQSATCPAWEGFAMIRASVSAPAAVGCSGGKNPPAVPKPDAREMLIGRQFFSTFWASTDCACAEASKQHLLGPGSALTGTIRGILILEVHPGSQGAFQVFEPLSRAMFPVAGG